MKRQWRQLPTSFWIFIISSRKEMNGSEASQHQTVTQKSIRWRDSGYKFLRLIKGKLLENVDDIGLLWGSLADMGMIWKMPYDNHCSEKPQWLKHGLLVNHGWFELVFESLGHSSDNSRKQIFRETFLSVPVYWNCMLCVLIRIASSRQF